MIVILVRFASGARRNFLIGGKTERRILPGLFGQRALCGNRPHHGRHSNGPQSRLEPREKGKQRELEASKMNGERETVERHAARKVCDTGSPASVDCALYSGVIAYAITFLKASIIQLARLLFPTSPRSSLPQPVNRNPVILR